jgi:recombination protein RecT
MEGKIMSNQLTLAQTIKAPSVNEFLDNVLGENKKQFLSDLMALQEGTPKLKDCDQMQLIKCAVTATALNLPLNKNLGYAYVIPYENKNAKITEPQFQMGYKGYIQLAMRTGKYKTINVCEVRQGEMIRNKFTGEVAFIEELPNNEIIGYLAYFKMLNGMEQSVYMSIEEVTDHADRYSMSFSKDNYKKLLNNEINQKDMWKFSSPWYKQFDVMAKKTVLKQLLTRWGVMTTELSTAVDMDQTNGEKNNYIDNDNNKIQAEFETKDIEIELVEQKEMTIENLKSYCEINDLDVLKVSQKYKLNAKSTNEDIQATINDLDLILEDPSIEELKVSL